MRLRSSRKKQKGGKILGAGADGCIFSQSAWPCSTETDISGYNVSDPKVVAKMVEKSDKEDTIIAIATSILSEADAKHLIKNYGVCSPVDNTTTDSTKIAVLDENINDIMALNNTSVGNACAELKGVTSSEIQKTRKILVNSRYNSDLHHYIIKYYNTVNIISKVLKAAIPFSAILKKLATNSGNSLVNMDLHTGNIFVNFDTLGGPLTMGMADYGRCCYYDIKKSENFNKHTWRGALIRYMSEYDLQLNFPIIPIECRLFNSYILNPRLNNEEGIINHIIALCEQNRDIIYESTDPFYFVEGQLPKLLNIFTPFIKYVVNFPRLSIIEKEALLDFVLYRFITVGFIGSLISSITITTEFRNESPAIISATSDYIKFYDEPDYKHRFNMNLVSHRLVKFYFDELLAPYKNDFTDIIQVRENEKMRNFTKIFADAMIIPPGPPILPSGPPGLPPGLPPRPVVSYYISPPSVAVPPGAAVPPYPVLPPRKNGKSVKTRRKRN
jgi:hypothetical protein